MHDRIDSTGHTLHLYLFPFLFSPFRSVYICVRVALCLLLSLSLSLCVSVLCNRIAAINRLTLSTVQPISYSFSVHLHAPSQIARAEAVIDTKCNINQSLSFTSDAALTSSLLFGITHYRGSLWAWIFRQTGWYATSVLSRFSQLVWTDRSGSTASALAAWWCWLRLYR